MDVSADLLELARTDVCVVSAGVKSILDIGRTLEVLETQGVPAITLGAAEFPAFYSRSSGFASPLSVATSTEAARVLHAMGLDHHVAPVVVLAGHGSQSVNNPHAAGLGYEEGATGTEWQVFHDAWDAARAALPAGV